MKLRAKLGDKDVIEEDDEKIPEDRASEIIEMAKESLGDAKGIDFEIRGKAVKIIRATQINNPRADIGY